jgi:hypothetical protein
MWDAAGLRPRGGYGVLLLGTGPSVISSLHLPVQLGQQVFQRAALVLMEGPTATKSKRQPAGCAIHQR